MHPGEKVTEGLDGLGPRLAEYHELGARFAKWRAVYAISDALPSQACFSANAHGLARYAALCQAHDIVPIVEPEAEGEVVLCENVRFNTGEKADDEGLVVDSLGARE